MTKIFFVRHAQSDWKWKDDPSRPLTDEGLLDRAMVLEFLLEKTVDSFYSSPYVRAIDTIRPAAESRGKGIRTNIRLRERASGRGPMTAENLLRRWRDFSFAEAGGECLQSVQARNIECLEEILDKEEGRTVVIGTHGTALSTIWNFYDSTIGIDDFLGLIDLMPMVLRFTFERHRAVRISKELGIRKKYKGKDKMVEEAREARSRGE